MYGSMLSQLAAKASPQPATLGLGSPPDMPGLPPPATGMGAMPTGNAASDPKTCADTAIMALRDAQGHFPALKAQMDAMVDALKSAAQAPAQPPAAPAGAPTPPGAALPPSIDSGSAGAA